MKSDPPVRIENNTNTFSGSKVAGTSIAAGSHASAVVSTGLSPEDSEVATAIAQLRKALDDVTASLDRRDDDTRESLTLAASRISALEEEMAAPKEERDRGRVTKLLAGIRDAVVGLTSLTVSADGLWEAVERVIR